jgi:hypothetical protein
MYGLIAKYPALEGFEEHLTEFLSDNSMVSSFTTSCLFCFKIDFVNLKRYVNSNNPYWVFCGTAALVMLGKRSTWQGFEVFFFLLFLFIFKFLFFARLKWLKICLMSSHQPI